ncbi:c-type cytochrome [Dokdonella ginsengisoli]|uniref:C-type cytochrome n=1 Tax=Dokdonella ginsengisoli TaxID=363846 RepID=A0ABV9QVB2_9GAMM
MKAIAKTVLALGLVAAGGAGVVYSGVYDVGADAPHTRPVYALLELARERSIAVRAARLEVPPGLDDPARIRRGAGNYEAMCAGCHLKPGSAPTELSRGLYPAPPDLTRASVPVTEAFWVVKHGIKASGMPAWGRSMADEHIWNMAAFLRQLPQLDRAAYDALVAASEGHSHGGGESEEHSHADGGGDHHGDAPHAHDEAPVAAPAAQGATHVHADGKTHVHPSEPTPAGVGHAH